MHTTQTTHIQMPLQETRVLTDASTRIEGYYDGTVGIASHFYITGKGTGMVAIQMPPLEALDLAARIIHTATRLLSVTPPAVR